jgi:hypothetical protein
VPHLEESKVSDGGDVSGFVTLPAEATVEESNFFTLQKRVVMDQSCK